MKHHLFVWGTNPQPFRGKADSSIVLPISVEEMARIGIPARKIPRVRLEVQRLIAADPALRDRKMGLPLWLCPAVCDRMSIVPCIICGNCDRIRLFCRETDGTKEEARTMQGIPCGWEHI